LQKWLTFEFMML